MVSSTIPSTQIGLSGLFKDPSACDYAVLQDDLVRVGADDFVAYIRVMRQRAAYVQTGTLRISQDVFRALGATDVDRNSALARALVLWLQNRSLRLRFALRVTASHAPNGTADVRFDEAPVQSS